MTTQATAQRVWTLAIPAPEPMKSSNTREHWAPTSKSRKAWRETAYGRAALAKLPRGLCRVRVDVELRFTAQRRRDAPNYHAGVVKPCIDALTPERRVPVKGGGFRVERGWGLIPDDTADFLDLHVRIGVPVPRGSYPHGLVVLTITDLTPTPEGAHL